MSTKGSASLLPAISFCSFLKFSFFSQLDWKFWMVDVFVLKSRQPEVGFLRIWDERAATTKGFHVPGINAQGLSAPFPGMVGPPGHWTDCNSAVEFFTLWHGIFSGYWNINDLSSFKATGFILQNTKIKPSPLPPSIFILCFTVLQYLVNLSRAPSRPRKEMYVFHIFGYRWKMGMLKDMYCCYTQSESVCMCHRFISANF